MGGLIGIGTAVAVSTLPILAVLVIRSLRNPPWQC